MSVVVGAFFTQLMRISSRIILAAALAPLPRLAGAQQADTTQTKLQQIEQRVVELRRQIRARADSNRYVHLADSLLDARDRRARLKYDTLYIEKPAERWTVKLRANVSGNDLLVRSVADGQHTETNLKADHRVTLSMAVGYRGMTLGVALNPMKLAGKSKDIEYNLCSYGNKLGFDAMYSTANTFAGTYEGRGRNIDVAEGEVRQQLASIGAYYAFNHRRFSYSAAFTQSQRQLRSAGSWLLALSALGCKIDDRTANATAIGASSFKYFNLGLGGGYGYNLVAGRWLLHGSLTSEVVALTYSRMEMEGQRVKAPYRFPNFIVQGRVAALYHWRTQFAGLTAVSHFSNTGDKDELSVHTVKWRVRLFYGLRF